MQKQSIIIFGAGRFGSALCRGLAKSRHEVLVVDRHMERVEAVSNYVDAAVQLDIADDKALSELGLSNFDLAVVAIGEAIDASILATLACTEAGVKKIVAKVGSSKQAKILERLGANKLIYPERDSAVTLASSIKQTDIISYIHFSDRYSIAELDLKEAWINKSLDELNLRAKYNINVVAVKKRNRKTVVNPDPHELLERDDRLVVVAEDRLLEELNG